MIKMLVSINSERNNEVHVEFTEWKAVDFGNWELRSNLSNEVKQEVKDNENSTKCIQKVFKVNEKEQRNNLETFILKICEAQCTNCSIKSEIIRFKARCQSCKSLLRYNCTSCLKSYKKYNDICQHIEVKHLVRLSPKPYKCNNCEKCYKLQKQLNYHKNNHCGENFRKYQCAHCNYNSTVKYNLHSHIRDKHIETNFECNKCSRTYTNKRSWVRHLSVYCGKKETFECIKCKNTRFFRKDQLVLHMKKLHFNDI